MGRLKIAQAGSDWADSCGCESFNCAAVWGEQGNRVNEHKEKRKKSLHAC